MKFLLTLVVVLNSMYSFSQGVPQKGISQLLIKNRLSASENYNLIIKTLSANNYFIESKDIELHYLKTQSKNIEKSPIVYFLNIISKDNEIVISGMFKSGIELNVGNLTSTDDYETITFRGARGSIYMKSFEKMQEFAEKFNFEISYK